MWRTLLAVLPEIANPLSLEMSCVAWPRTTQVRTSHPPRSQALSLQCCLLSWLSLSEISHCWSVCGTWKTGYYRFPIQLWVLVSCSVIAQCVLYMLPAKNILLPLFVLPHFIGTLYGLACLRKAWTLHTFCQAHLHHRNPITVINTELDFYIAAYKYQMQQWWHACKMKTLYI